MPRPLSSERSTSRSTFSKKTSAIPLSEPRKYDESRNLWQARVNKDWRFYFTIEKDTYRLQAIIPHPK
jgi:hypothetical protein